MWLLIVVVGTLTFIGNDVYDDRAACERAKSDLGDAVSAGECASWEALKGKMNPPEEEPERSPSPNGKAHGLTGPRDGSDG